MGVSEDMSGDKSGTRPHEETCVMKGMELSQRFYEAYGRKMIADGFLEYESIIAVGIAGEGSDCFGYDDELSRDHDFEAGFCLWIPDSLDNTTEFRLSRAYHKLPGEYLGVRRVEQSLWGQGRRGVMRIGDFYRRFTGRPGSLESLTEWLYTPEYSLACAVNGRVFRDDLGEFSRIRRELSAGYPEDIRKKKLAARLAFMAQSGQYNYTRCMKRGEPGAAALALGEFVQNATSAIFLLNRRYMPYYKWMFRALRELPLCRDAACLLEPVLLSDRQQCSAPCVSEQIEQICAEVVRELRNQQLTGGSWDYLEPHAYEVQERILDHTLRTMHIMEG